MKIGLKPDSSEMFEEENINSVGEVYDRKENVWCGLSIGEIDTGFLETDKNEGAQDHGNEQHP